MEPVRKDLPIPGLFRWKFWRVLLLTVVGLITLFALFRAEENWRGKRDWEDYKREMEAKGETFDFARFVPPLVADAQNFAMTPFLAPLFDFAPGTQHERDSNGMQRIRDATQLPNEVQTDLNKLEWRGGKPLDLASLANELLATNRSAPPRFAPGHTQEAARALLEKLKAEEPVFDELRTASQRRYSRFNIDYDWEPKFGMLLPHLGTIGALCSMLELRASAELASSKPDEAFQDVGLMFHLTKSVQAEPLLISQVIRAACLGKTLQPMWEGLARRQWSDKQLEAFTRELGTLDFMGDGVQCLRAEQCFCDTFFTQLRQSRNPLREVNKISDSSAGPDFPGEVLGAIVPGGWFYFEQLNYHRLFDYETDAVMKPNRIDPDVADQRAEEVFGNLSSGLNAVLNHRAMARMLLPALNSVEYKMARAQTYANLAEVACALERYRLARGQYPDTFDALAPQFLAAVPQDVIMGQPLNYRRFEDGQFILYSVGWNKKDDGGVAVKESRDRTEGDWVWKYPAAPRG
jgi:hypothetical protein